MYIHDVYPRNVDDCNPLSRQVHTGNIFLFLIKLSQK